MLHCAAVRSTLGTPTDPQAPSTYLHCSTSLDVSISNLRRGLRQKGGVKTTKKKKKKGKLKGGAVAVMFCSDEEKR